MLKLFDKTSIENFNSVTEAYIGYGQNDLNKMTDVELRQELKRVEKDIKQIENEIDDADSYPSYAIKERLENEKWYKNKVMDEISKREENKSLEEKIDNTETKPKSMQDMIKDLDRQYERGLITKEYRDKYVDKLEQSIDAYEEKLKREQIEEEEKSHKEELKHRRFKQFKKKLSEYRK